MINLTKVYWGLGRESLPCCGFSGSWTRNASFGSLKHKLPQEIWYTSDTRVTHIWYSCDSHLILVWCTSDTRVMYIWYSCDSHLILVWCTSDNRVMYIWYSCDSHLILVWCTSNARVMYIWNLSDTVPQVSRTNRGELDADWVHLCTIQRTCGRVCITRPLIKTCIVSRVPRFMIYQALPETTNSTVIG